LGGDAIIGRIGKKWPALDRLNPDQQGIWSATLSEKRERCMTPPHHI